MKKKKPTMRILLVLTVFLLFVATLSVYLNWHKNYRGKINPNVFIGSIDLSGKTVEEVEEIIAEKTNSFLEKGLILKYGEKLVTIDLLSDSFDPDLSYRLAFFEIEKTIDKIIEKEGSLNFFRYLSTKLNSGDKKITTIYSLEEARLEELISQAFSELNIPANNAFFSFDKQSDSLKIVPEKIGKQINYTLALGDINNALENLSEEIIFLKTRSEYPSVKSSDLESLKEEAEKIINSNGLKIFYKKPETKTSSKLWTIGPEKLVTWLMTENKDVNLKLILDTNKIASYLQETVSPSIDIEPVKARFEIKDNKVSTWQRGIDGQKLNIASSSEKIKNDFFAGNSEVDLIIEKISSQSLNPEENYNIQEIIGTGHSNFAGSSVNRRKNISVGAQAVSGILIAPGEEFSLVKALGDVSAETGYFPELVIKDNKTIPEYGGGLCQVATTLFRAALESGLPITERRNHSYRVSYYEPAGMDAAVYIPNPDVRFINDTPDYILIQFRIEGNDIYFDFWGKEDGRTATTTKPVIYNIVKPEPTKYIESEDLAPGEEKCTERAHNGADAYFDYTVIYPEGSTTTPIQERRFNSHYVPWREVCLIGKELPSEEEIIQEENKTEEIIEEEKKDEEEIE